MPIVASPAQNQPAALTVDRLSLKLSGLTESDGRRLALLVSDGLAAAGLDDWTRVGTINIHASAALGVGNGNGIEGLSKQIVSEIIRQIRQV